MAVDVSSAGALARRIELQDRLRKAAHTTVDRTGNHASGKQLHHDIQKYLIKASDQGFLKEAQTEIYRDLLFTGPDRNNNFEIAVGNVRNFNRSKDLPHFTRRRDGGWFDFLLVVKEGDGRAEIILYDFELRLPAGGGFDFVRFDLNPPDNDKEQVKDGLRSHLHLNTDDDGLVAPAPVMSPFEILDLFLHGLCQNGRIRRSPAKEV